MKTKREKFQERNDHLPGGKDQGSSDISHLMIKEIPAKLTHQWLLYKHYARRLTSISYAFGLFKDQKLVGICTFGSALPMQMRRGVCGKEWQNKVFELNRLCTLENLSRNTLSYFVGQVLKMLPKPMIVVSYADMSQKHHGYIYQATNFLYTGTSHVQKDWKVRGKENKHYRALLDEVGWGKGQVERLKEKYGDLMYRVDRPIKHRYVYFLGSQKEIKQMKKALLYEVKPYPKGKNERYDASYEPSNQLTLV